MSRVARPSPSVVASARVGLVLGMLGLGGGCMHKVPLSCDPAGAYVSVAGERVGVAPLDLPVRAFGPRRVTVERTGYRTLEFRLPLLPPRAIEVRLVPEHGGAGTWKPEDVK
ncbi:MAG: PEGA domain-containing protein [Pseudomonadota bacterium]|nr:PEGA domain-containing protein [Pseudomonadota bacterium]